VRFSDLEGSSVGVWGAGREIRSFASQLERRLPAARITVIAFDSQPADSEVEAIAADARVVVGDDVVAALTECDVIVRSPGVTIHRPEMAELRRRDIPIVTATGLWLAEHGSHGVVGITGTKGKSTTAALAHHLARAADVDAALAGNIGTPALDLLDREPPELVLLELSSYQIADLETGPETAVITNLFREHLDWHHSEDVYREEKLRIFRLPGVRTAIVNARAPGLVAAVATTERVVHYGEPSGWDCDDAGVRRNGELVVAAADLPLPGPHNALNLCAALTALELAGIEPPLPGGLAGFGALPHRLQSCGERGGVLWIDDSISTTPESALAALAAFPDRDVILLAGGQDRGQDYAELGAALALRDAAVVGIPTTGGRAVAAARAAGVPAERAVATADLDAAVALARSLSRAGSAVLLSPAAPSYDSFRNFEERGDRFRELLGPA
jgi:UDP-N-acetylmuramoyl-L-alanine---L-glutamate ligase